MENELNVSEDQSILASVDESSTWYDSDDGYISTNDLDDIIYGNYVHSKITQYMLDLKYVSVLDKCKVIRKDQNYQQIGW